jgi:tetratricopeptide (TPR) repeat protein
MCRSITEAGRGGGSRRPTDGTGRRHGEAKPPVARQTWLMKRLSWKPINFDRWLCLAAVAGGSADAADNLVAAIERMRLSWERLRDDLDELFLPSGPPGTHAYHHFHAPSDPSLRERVLNACALDYETFLVYLEIGLQQSTQCVSGPAKLPMQNWKTLAEAAERGDAGLATEARDKILYLQRTVLYARHKGIVHPRAHIQLVSYDNVGNIMFWRLAPTLDEALVADLNNLLHEVRPDIRPEAKAGTAISVHMALTWVGSVASRVKDGKRFESLRDGLGYTLPGPYEVAPAVDAIVDAFIAALPETDFGKVAFAAGPTNSRRAPEAEDVAGPMAPEDPALVEHLFEEAASAGNAGRHQDAADGFRRILGLDPENGGAHLNLAKALIQLDDPEAAIEHLQAATAIEVPVADARPVLIQAHFNAAAAAFNRGDSAVAIANYRRVCELALDDVEARRHLAVALARGSRVDAALIEAARLDPAGEEDANVQCDIGIVLLAAGQFDAARDRFERALALRPGWDEAQRQLDALP